jgi:serine acetyltransferase
VTLSPNCTVNGENIVQEGVFFGSGAVTRDKIKIGKWCHIGACSVIVKNIPDNSLFFAASGTSKNF